MFLPIRREVHADLETLTIVQTKKAIREMRGSLSLDDEPKEINEGHLSMGFVHKILVKVFHFCCGYSGATGLFFLLMILKNVTTGVSDVSVWLLLHKGRF